MRGLPKVPIVPDQPGGPYDYPEGNVELFSDLRFRAKKAVDRWIGKHDQELVLFVAHGGIFSALHHELECGAYRKIENATPHEFSRQSDGTWTCQQV